MKLEPIIDMHCMVTGMWKRFSAHLFEGKVTVADMDRIAEEIAVWHAKIPGKVVELVVIFPSDAKMTSQERSKMMQIIKKWESSRTASATVILAQGILGSMHRSVLTGMQMIVPAPHPVKVFGAVEPAVAWLTPHIRELCGGEATESALLAAVSDLSKRFSERSKRQHAGT